MPKSPERLHAIAGRWATDGHVVGDPSVLIKGFHTYEVLPGGYFLVHHVEVTVGNQPVQAIEIIGERDPDSGGFLARSTTPACFASPAAPMSPLQRGLSVPRWPACAQRSLPPPTATR
jgi:hypothetical protein